MNYQKLILEYNKIDINDLTDPDAGRQRPTADDVKEAFAWLRSYYKRLPLHAKESLLNILNYGSESDQIPEIFSKMTAYLSNHYQVSPVTQVTVGGKNYKSRTYFDDDYNTSPAYYLEKATIYADANTVFAKINKRKVVVVTALNYDQVVREVANLLFTFSDIQNLKTFLRSRGFAMRNKTGYRGRGEAILFFKKAGK